MDRKVRILFFSSMLAMSVLSCGREAQRSDDGRDRRSDETAEVGCAQPGSVGDGLRCSCATDCLPGATCGFEADFGEPGGLCVRICTAGDDSCSQGSTCFDFVEQYGEESACSGTCEDDSDCGSLSCRDGACCFPGFCRPECDETSDCEAGRICDAGYCTGYCTEDSDCEGGECNHYTGVCGPTDQSKAGLSEPCLRHEDCRSDYCHEWSSTCESNCSVSLGGCPEDAFCVESDRASDLGVCVLECDEDGGCQGDFECVAIDDSTQVCALLEPEMPCEPAEGAALDRCECNAQCSSGGQCARESSEGFPGGACIVPCSGPTDCETDETCSTTGYCAKTCTGGDCGPGRVCGSSNYCRMACADDSECQSGLCNTYSGACVQEEPTGAGVLGECTDDDDCKSGFCASFGHCLTLCSSERGECPDEAICLTSGGSETGACTFPCEDESECKPYGLLCVDGFCQ